MSVGSWLPGSTKYPCAAGLGNVVEEVNVVALSPAGEKTLSRSTAPSRFPVTACTTSPAST